MPRVKTLATAISVALAVAALAGCSKEPEAAKPATPAATAAATAPAGPASTGAAPAAPVGNPEAAKDPAFNMPAQPVLDVSKSKEELDKIAKDALK